jgi:hypothetical protein
MKIFNILMIAIIAISILVLTGCEKTDGKLELKEPRKELSDMPERKSWFDTPISQQPTNGSQE